MSSAQDGTRNMWCAVIDLSITDAISEAKSLEIERRQARAWFGRSSADFREVCALAGLEPEWVRTEALKRIAEHDERIAAGMSKQKKGRKGSLRKASEHQSKPKRAVQKYQFKGESLTLKEWSRRTGIKVTTLHSRFRAGWSVERAFETRAVPGGGFALNPLGELAKRVFFEGESLTVQQWSLRTGIKAQVLHMRLSSGWSVEHTLTTPTKPRGPRSQSPLTAAA